MTSKGQQNYLIIFEKQMKGLNKDICKRITFVDNLCKSSSSDSSIIKKELNFIDDLQKQIWLIFEKAKNLLTPEDYESHNDWIGRIEQEVYFVKSRKLCLISFVTFKLDNGLG